MSLPLDFNAATRGEVRAAYEWYERQRRGLGSRFLDAVQNLLTRIGTNPDQFGYAKGDVREGLMKRFPYAIYYRVLPDRIRILSIHHTSRDPAEREDRV